MRASRRTRQVLLLALLAISASSARARAQEESGDARSDEAGPTVGRFAEITLRFGAGGFRDGRSPEGELGGDQLAIDVKAASLPVTLSFSSEFYTNGPDPTHPYEIESAYSINIVRSDRLFGSDRVRYFVGGGIGRLWVPSGGRTPGERVGSGFYNLGVGADVSVWRGFGLYGSTRYLHAERTVSSVKVVDFNEVVVLLGVTFRFGL